MWINVVLSRGAIAVQCSKLCSVSRLDLSVCRIHVLCHLSNDFCDLQSVDVGVVVYSTALLHCGELETHVSCLVSSVSSHAALFCLPAWDYQ